MPLNVYWRRPPALSEAKLSETERNLDLIIKLGLPRREVIFVLCPERLRGEMSREAAPVPHPSKTARKIPLSKPPELKLFTNHFEK
jgi:hypothetical protein